MHVQAAAPHHINPKIYGKRPNNESELSRLPEDCKHICFAKPCSLPEQVPIHQRSCFELTTFTDNDEEARVHSGGKGLFLQKMEEAGLPVPPFKIIHTKLMGSFEKCPLPPELLEQFLPGTEMFKASRCLDELKAQAFDNPEQQSQWLAGLVRLIKSCEFYNQVKSFEASDIIRGEYKKLTSTFYNTPVIVRSSGITEDCYGKAQAGKFDSKIHGYKDIVRTCLCVMASGYDPEAHGKDGPQPMAIILQHCINCRFGGVAISHITLKDDTIRVEYAPGQPKTVVSGNYNVTPHRYQFERTAVDDIIHYISGNTPIIVTLQEQDGRFLEVESQVGNTSQEIDEITLRQLSYYIKMLENQLMCPVDVEFAIDQQGQLQLLQVRPVTKLPGGMRFTLGIPEEPVISGKLLVSEGFCTGEYFPALDNKELNHIPQNAIVFAKHSSLSMVKSEVLQRVRGFVFQHGGTTDHVAITLQQEGIPCLVAGEGFDISQARDYRIITLVCGDFNNTPCAFVLAGDQTQLLEKNIDASVKENQWLVPATDYFPNYPEFKDPCTGLQWLNRQNNQLLGYFHSSRLTNLCLTSGHCTQLSMSPNRGAVLTRLETELDHLLNELENFVTGYSCFLELAKTNGSIPPALSPFFDELPIIKNHVTELGGKIKTHFMKISRQLNHKHKPYSWGNSFKEWQRDCQTLNNYLTKLNTPQKCHYIESVHDLIFYIHKEFVKVIGPIAIHSGQGEVSIEGRDKYITFRDTGNKSDTNLLDCASKEAIRLLGRGKKTIVVIPGTLIVNAELGSHICTIEMHESANTDKGRTLLIDLSDDFSSSRICSTQSMLQRFWVFIQLLKVSKFYKYADDFTVTLNEESGKVLVEYCRVESHESLHQSFHQVCNILSSLANVDIILQCSNLDENGLCWDWSVLKNRLDHAEENTDFFIQCLLVVCRNLDFNMHFTTGLTRTFQELCEASRVSKISSAENIINCIKRNKYKDKFIQFLLLVDPEKAEPLLEKNWLKMLNNKGNSLRLVRQSGLTLKIIPQPLRSDRELILAAIQQNGLALQYADIECRSDPSTVSLAIKDDPSAFAFAGDNLKNDTDFILDNINIGINTPAIIKDVSEHLKKDGTFMLKVVKKNRRCVSYIPDELQENKEFVLEVIRYDGKCFLRFKEKIKQKLEYIWAARTACPQAVYRDEHNKDMIILKKIHLGKLTAKDFAGASEELKSISDAIQCAIELDPWVLMYVDHSSNDDKDMLITAVQIIDQAIIDQGSDDYWAQFDDSAVRHDFFQQWKKKLESMEFPKEEESMDLT